MSNGYLLAADADLPGLQDVASGFGLQAVGANTLGSLEATAGAMQGAANVGIVLSDAATRDVAFMALLHLLARSLRNAQLILAETDARTDFGFLPEAWPTMALSDAVERARDLLRRRAESEASANEEPRAHPLPPVEQEVQPPEAPQDPNPELEPEPEPELKPEPMPEPTPEPDPESPEPESKLEGELSNESALQHETAAPETNEDIVGGAPPDDGRKDDGALSDAFGSGTPSGEAPSTEEELEPEAPPEPAAPPAYAEPPPPPATMTPAPAPAPAPQSVEPPRRRAPENARAGGDATAPADATAFAPKKMRRGTPELVRIVIHQPKDLKDVIKAARQIDPRTDAAPSGMKVGDVALGASVGVSLEVRGAECDGAIQRRVWQGEAIDFNFSADADGGVKQVIFLARVFIDDAQIGVLAFTRPVGGPKKNAASADRVRLKRHKRVFLSYSSKDRETVSAIATAYEAAGVQHFFDRTSLKSGEEWSPRLRQEIDRADLFHLCWSKSASESQWVVTEAEHALTRRRRSNGKKPDITVQMLDGPPWAKHPDSLDSINFDDFVRAAIVGYARGDGQS
ncbi:toll/interleukin-1 receptor domain-containing protein [Candidatus Viadribacter manganicus]|uniref:TIR domain-containing protein n=1 Tax=Candidatus Viadribacter manganicus TaxID=1759059 RepID=A0A1B1AKF0_9PROT|nr:toll/interleukin-1 receptor domain-containing protein [Candidatus Viadribacter manganicus]ANP47049.1 hypothetical protein ATE48_14565 [Candidatus Viadribacter manganicus]